MKLGLSSLLLIVAITGCQVGPRIDELEQARRPEGATTTIKLHYGFAEGDELKGELLEVQEKGLLLNASERGQGKAVTRRLVFVPYTAAIDIKLDTPGVRAIFEADTEGGRVLHQEQLRLLSRFPQGLSAPLLEQLLEAQGQKTVYVLGTD